MGTLIRNARVEAPSAASVEAVWAVIADVTRTGEWSHECKQVELLDGATDTRPGTRFRGRNVCGRSRWSRVNEVVAVDAPRELVWRTVPTRLFPDSTVWRIRVEPAPRGSTIVQSYDVVKLNPIIDRLFWLFVPAPRSRGVGRTTLRRAHRGRTGKTHMRIGAFVSETWGPGSDLDEVRRRARAVEAAGLASGWAPYLPWAVDAITAAHVAGSVTSRIDVGTSVVPTYLWNPLALARHAGTVASDLGGRFVLGIGPSHATVIEQMHGIPYRRPARHTREVLDVLAAARAGSGRVDYAGEMYTISALYANGPTADYPVWVGAMGERMLAVAGAHADGAIATMSSPTAIAKVIVPGITAAANEAGRPAPRVAAVVPVAATSDVAAAREAAATNFAVYDQIPRYQRIIELGGASSAPEIPVLGDAAAIRTRLREYADAGLTDFIAAPFCFGDDRATEWQRTIDTLAELAGDL